ncbi:hypothetical protein SteCoe_33070 [Stentor coeruleus]|uniref:Uncharacterized protein n=1 Tax=Stentor coeruleus TaxID=5963 RepID=A0A1R2AXS4_9CILI|nr:hypothetical protein SteCoe_33070 [Stentor coeruleus]
MVDPKTQTTIKTPALIQEYIELKRLNTENPALIQKNEYLRNEISALEIKYAELEAKMAARENELKKYTGKFPNDIDTQIKILELENSRLRESLKPQQNELYKNEHGQNLQFKSIYETSFKEIMEKYYCKSPEMVNGPNNPLENEKQKLTLQLKKQEILLQEALNDKNYIKNDVLPVLEHTLHLYEKNKFDLDGEIEGLEAKLRIPSPKKPENIIYEEEEFELPNNTGRNSGENSPAISPKQSLQYSFISANKFSARPASAKISLASPRNKFMSVKSKKTTKLSK